MNYPTIQLPTDHAVLMCRWCEQQEQALRETPAGDTIEASRVMGGAMGTLQIIREKLTEAMNAKEAA